MASGTLHQIAETNGRLRCETLGVELFLREDDLVIVDTETGVEQVTKADAEELAREQELEPRLIAERRVRELEEKIRRLEGGN